MKALSYELNPKTQSDIINQVRETLASSHGVVSDLLGVFFVIPNLDDPDSFYKIVDGVLKKHNIEFIKRKVIESYDDENHFERVI